MGTKKLYENGPNPFFCFFQSYGNENGPDSYSQIRLRVCGSVSEFNIAGTGGVYITKAYLRMKEHFVFPPRRSGSRSESKTEDSVVTSRDKEGCKEECSSGVKF